MTYYLMVYGILAGCNTIFTLARAFLFAYGGVCAATKIHRYLLKSILKVRSDLFISKKKSFILRQNYYLQKRIFCIIFQIETLLCF